MPKVSRVKVTKFSKRTVVLHTFFGTELYMCVLTKLCDNLNKSKNKDNTESNKDSMYQQKYRGGDQY